MVFQNGSTSLIDLKNEMDTLKNAADFIASSQFIVVIDSFIFTPDCIVKEIASSYESTGNDLISGKALINLPYPALNNKGVFIYLTRKCINQWPKTHLKINASVAFYLLNVLGNKPQND